MRIEATPFTRDMSSMNAHCAAPSTSICVSAICSMERFTMLRMFDPALAPAPEITAIRSSRSGQAPVFWIPSSATGKIITQAACDVRRAGSGNHAYMPPLQPITMPAARRVTNLNRVSSRTPACNRPVPARPRPALRCKARRACRQRTGGLSTAPCCAASHP